MNNTKTIAVLVLAAIFIFGGFKKKAAMTDEGKWTGTVSFYEKRTGGKIVRSDWWMIGTITGNIGNGLDSSIFENTDGDKAKCATSEKTELELGIDGETNEYDITVNIPGCYGTKTDRYGKTESYGLCDETAIMINHQKLGSDPDLLEGRIRTVQGPDASGSSIIIIYEWHLKRVK